MAKQPQDPAATAAANLAAKAFADRVKVEMDRQQRRADPAGAAKADAKDRADKFSGVVSALQSIAGRMGSPTGAVSAIGGGIGQMVGGAAGTYISALAQLPALFKSGADSIAQFVSAFSPATANRYTQAWSDLTASIGENLLPILQMATGVVRFFADIVAGLTPVIRPVVDQLTRITSAFGGAFQDVFNELLKTVLILDTAFAPIRELLIDIATGPIQLLTWGLQQMAEWLKTATTQLALFMGVEVPKIEGASMGKAAQSTQTTTVDALLKSLREKAFMVGNEARQQDPAKKSANLLQQIYEWVVNTLPGVIGAQAAAIIAGIVAGFNTVMEKGKEAAALSGSVATAVGNAYLPNAMSMLNNLRQIVPGIPNFAGP